MRQVMQHRDQQVGRGWASLSGASEIRNHSAHLVLQLLGSGQGDSSKFIVAVQVHLVPCFSRRGEAMGWH
jgi:hypothetical protein